MLWGPENLKMESEEKTSIMISKEALITDYNFSAMLPLFSRPASIESFYLSTPVLCFLIDRGNMPLKAPKNQFKAESCALYKRLHKLH